MNNRVNPEDEKLYKAVLLLNAKMLGLILGLLFGTAIFLATIFLVLKGGHTTDTGEYVVGPHLQLLGQFFIGYRVSYFGSIIGFLYGFAVGTITGALIGRIYNKIVELRQS